MSQGILSIVVPVFNEEDSLRTLTEEINKAIDPLDKQLDLIFVDDGSTDQSWARITELAREDGRVRGIRFRRNFGKAAALVAGFRAAIGDITMTLDADLQDDPNEIPRFLEQIESGLDVVSGWKKIRHDPWHKVLPSRIFNRMVGWVTGVRLHDINCGMKCYRTEVFQEIRLYGELHRFIPVLAAARGFKVGEIVIAHRARQFGTSKYGFGRFIKGFLDLMTVRFLTRFGQRPQHAMGSYGLIFSALGMLGMGYLAVTWLINHFIDATLFDTPLHQRPLLTYSLASFLFGVQLVVMGVLAELIVVHQTRDEDTFSIAEQTTPNESVTFTEHD